MSKASLEEIAKQWRDHAEVIAAYAAGETIQFESILGPHDCTLVDRNINTDKVELEFVGSPWQYRLKPKPEPKLPDGVFWIRHNKTDKFLLVIAVGQVGVMSYSYGAGGVRPLSFEFLFKSYLWSHDRKTWFTFTGEEVKS